MKAAVWSWLLVGVVLCATVPAGAQTPVGALAIDERQGDQYGWAVYYETPAAAREIDVAGRVVVLECRRDSRPGLRC